MSPVRTLPSGRVGAYHVPVLLAEIEALLVGASTVLDCTLGGGGHTAALLERGMRVTGVDRDPRALAAARVSSRTSNSPKARASASSRCERKNQRVV